MTRRTTTRVSRVIHVQPASSQSSPAVLPNSSEESSAARATGRVVPASDSAPSVPVSSVPTSPVAAEQAQPAASKSAGWRGRLPLRRRYARITPDAIDAQPTSSQSSPAALPNSSEGISATGRVVPTSASAPSVPVSSVPTSPVAAEQARPAASKLAGWGERFRRRRKVREVIPTTSPAPASVPSLVSHSSSVPSLYLPNLPAPSLVSNSSLLWFGSTVVPEVSSLVSHRSSVAKDDIHGVRPFEDTEHDGVPSSGSATDRSDDSVSSASSSQSSPSLLAIRAPIVSHVDSIDASASASVSPSPVAELEPAISVGSLPSFSTSPPTETSVASHEASVAVEVAEKRSPATAAAAGADLEARRAALRVALRRAAFLKRLGYNVEVCDIGALYQKIGDRMEVYDREKGVTKQRIPDRKEYPLEELDLNFLREVVELSKVVSKFSKGKIEVRPGGSPFYSKAFSGNGGGKEFFFTEEKEGGTKFTTIAFGGNGSVWYRNNHEAAEGFHTFKCKDGNYVEEALGEVKSLTNSLSELLKNEKARRKGILDIRRGRSGNYYGRILNSLQRSFGKDATWIAEASASSESAPAPPPPPPPAPPASAAVESLSEEFLSNDELKDELNPSLERHATEEPRFAGGGGSPSASSAVPASASSEPTAALPQGSTTTAPSKASVSAPPTSAPATLSAEEERVNNLRKELAERIKDAYLNKMSMRGITKIIAEERYGREVWWSGHEPAEDKGAVVGSWCHTMLDIFGGKVGRVGPILGDPSAGHLPLLERLLIACYDDPKFVDQTKSGTIDKTLGLSCDQDSYFGKYLRLKYADLQIAKPELKDFSYDDFVVLVKSVVRNNSSAIAGIMMDIAKSVRGKEPRILTDDQCDLLERNRAELDEIVRLKLREEDDKLGDENPLLVAAVNALWKRASEANPEVDSDAKKLLETLSVEIDPVQRELMALGASDGRSSVGRQAAGSDLEIALRLVKAQTPSSASSAAAAAEASAAAASLDAASVSAAALAAADSASDSAAPPPASSASPPSLAAPSISAPAISPAEKERIAFAAIARAAAAILPAEKERVNDLRKELAERIKDAYLNKMSMRGITKIIAEERYGREVWWSDPKTAENKAQIGATVGFWCHNMLGKFGGKIDLTDPSAISLPLLQGLLAHPPAGCWPLLQRLLIACYDDPKFVDQTKSGTIDKTLGLSCDQDSYFGKYLRLKYADLQIAKPELKDFSYDDFVVLVKSVVRNNSSAIAGIMMNVAESVRGKEPPILTDEECNLILGTKGRENLDGIGRENLDGIVRLKLQGRDSELNADNGLVNAVNKLWAFSGRTIAFPDAETNKLFATLSTEIDPVRREIRALLGADGGRSSVGRQAAGSDLEIAVRLVKENQRRVIKGKVLIDTGKDNQIEDFIDNTVAAAAQTTIARDFRDFKLRRDFLELKDAKERRKWPRFGESQFTDPELVDHSFDVEAVVITDFASMERSRKNYAKDGKNHQLRVLEVAGEELREHPSGLLVEYYQGEDGLRALFDQAGNAARSKDVPAGKTRVSVAFVDKYAFEGSASKRSSYCITSQVRGATTQTFISERQFSPTLGESKALCKTYLDHIRKTEALREELDYLMIVKEELALVEGYKKRFEGAKDSMKGVAANLAANLAAKNPDNEELKSAVEELKSAVKTIDRLFDGDSSVTRSQIDKALSVLTEHGLDKDKVEAIQESASLNLAILSLKGVLKKDVEFKPEDSVEVRKEKIERFAVVEGLEVDVKLSVSSDDPDDPRMGRIGEALERVRALNQGVVCGSKATEDQIITAKKYASDELHHNLAKEAERSAEHRNRHELDFTLDEVDMMKQQWEKRSTTVLGRTFNTAARQSSMASLDRLLKSPLPDSPHKGATSILRHDNDTVTINFNGGELNTVYVYLEGTSQCYARVRQATKPGKMKVFENGRFVDKEECQIGDIVVDEGIFHKGRDGHYQPMTPDQLKASLGEEGRYAADKFKDLKVKAVGVREDGKRSVGILFNGQSSSHEVSRLKSAFRLDRPVITKLNQRVAAVHSGTDDSCTDLVYEVDERGFVITKMEKAVQKAKDSGMSISVGADARDVDIRVSETGEILICYDEGGARKNIKYDCKFDDVNGTVDIAHPAIIAINNDLCGGNMKYCQNLARHINTLREELSGIRYAVVDRVYEEEKKLFDLVVKIEIGEDGQSLQACRSKPMLRYVEEDGTHFSLIMQPLGDITNQEKKDKLFALFDGDERRYEEYFKKALVRCQLAEIGFMVKPLLAAGEKEVEEKRELGMHHVIKPSMKRSDSIVGMLRDKAIGLARQCADMLCVDVPKEDIPSSSPTPVAAEQVSRSIGTTRDRSRGA